MPGQGQPDVAPRAPEAPDASEAPQAPAPRVRPVEAADLAGLAPLDDRYARGLGLEPYVNLGSLHYFGRSGHSFVAEDPSGAAVGFALAHSTWTGGEPALRLERLAVADQQGGTVAVVASALVEAVVKSAYDAGVYRLAAESPAADDVGRRALESKGFTSQATVAYWRRLGSAGAGGRAV